MLNVKERTAENRKYQRDVVRSIPVGTPCIYLTTLYHLSYPVNSYVMLRVLLLRPAAFVLVCVYRGVLR